MNYEVKVGSACNNNCVFCLNEKRGWRRETGDLMKEIESLPYMDEINFTGGEVTIRDDFFDL
ncbi:hypothetical protein ACFL0V_07230, partial [Nanoarchaeota archaeon]